MAFELLEPSLEDLFRVCGSRFIFKMRIMIAHQILGRLQMLHSKGLVHRDMKLENFLLGTGKTGNVIYITDFGLAIEVRQRVHPSKNDLV